MAHYLGVDVGTAKIAALLLDAESGRQIATHELTNVVESTSEEDHAIGRREWDAERMTSLAFECIRGVLEKASGVEVRAVGVAGQMHGMVLVREGRAISPLIGWQDQRCQEIMPGRDVNYIGRMLDLGGVGGFARTGCPPATGYLGATLFWLASQRDPRVSAGHAAGIKACFMSDYVVMRLTGEGPAIDPSNAGGSGLFDVASRLWNRTLINRLGLDPDLFPPVVTGGPVVGGITAEAAKATGLPAGTPVRVGCGDNQASFAGGVAEPEESIFVNIGTGAQISAWVPRFIGAEAIDTRPYFGKGFLLVGAPLCGGFSYALLRDFIREVGARFFGAKGDEDLYERMTALAASVPTGADGLRCEPLFTGTRLDPNRRASMAGMTAANFTPGHFARAFLEGVAQQLLKFYRDMQESGVRPRRILIGSGNGIRKNPLLPRIVAEMFGMPLRVPESAEEAAFGAALLAAVAVKEFTNLAEARHLIAYGPEIGPGTT
jgi:sugar (pentulose or hexulose) kinase